MIMFDIMSSSFPERTNFIITLIIQCVHHILKTAKDDNQNEGNMMEQYELTTTDDMMARRRPLQWRNPPKAAADKDVYQVVLGSVVIPALAVLLLAPWHEVLVCIDGQLQPSTFSCTSPDSSSGGFDGYNEWTYILHVSYMFKKPSMCEIKWCSRMFFPSRVYPHIPIAL